MTQRGTTRWDADWIILMLIVLAIGGFAVGGSIWFWRKVAPPPVSLAHISEVARVLRLTFPK